MSGHLKAQVEDGRVVQIKCMDMDCDLEFTENDIKNFGSDEIYKKFLRFKENIDVELDPNLKWCP